jgi:hypothetical protein
VELYELQLGCTDYNIPKYSPIPHALALYRKADKFYDKECDIEHYLQLNGALQR